MHNAHTDSQETERATFIDGSQTQKWQIKATVFTHRLQLWIKTAARSLTCTHLQTFKFKRNLDDAFHESTLDYYGERLKKVAKCTTHLYMYICHSSQGFRGNDGRVCKVGGSY